MTRRYFWAVSLYVEESLFEIAVNHINQYKNQKLVIL